MRLLLVDDERPLLRVLHAALDEHFEVFTASCVATAARAVESVGPDAIVCDLGLPDADGTCLHDFVSARWPALARRMVFMTGGIHRSIRAKALASGCPILEKPFSVNELVGIVHRVTDGAATHAPKRLAGNGHR